MKYKNGINNVNIILLYFIGILSNCYFKVQSSELEVVSIGEAKSYVKNESIYPKLTFF